MSNNIKGIIWGVCAVIGFAFMGIMVKIAQMKFPFSASELVFWRTFPAIFVLGAIAQSQKQSFKTPYFWLHIGRSVSGCVSMMLFFYAVSLLPLSTAVTLSYTSSLSLALLSFLILGERISKLTLSALWLGFFGVALLLRPELFGLAKLGILSAIGSSLIAGLAYLQLREMAKTGEPSWRIVFYLSVICSIVAGIMTCFSGWHRLSASSLIYIFAISGSALIGQMCLTRAYAIGEKFTISALSYLTVVFSATFAHFYFGEILDLWKIIAMILIICAGILSALPPKKPQ